jgi:hypothetical protein
MTDTPDAHAHPSDRSRAEGEPGSARRSITPGAVPPNGSVNPFAPATPARAAAAVLDSQPAAGGRAGSTPTTFGWPSSPAGSEPPPFGFNAPRPTAPQAGSARANGAGAASPQPSAMATPSAATAAGPAVAEPQVVAPGVPAPIEPGAMRPEAPQAPTFARPVPLASRPTPAPPASQPRELMPATIPMETRRIGETVTPTFGPPGKHRSTAAMVALSVLTLGVYAIAWHRRVNQEMGDFDPRIHVHPAESAWAVFVPWFLCLLGSAAAVGMVLAAHYNLDLHLPVTGRQVLPGVATLAAVQYLILFLPFSLVAVVRTAERVRMVEEHAGVTADEQIRPAALAGWLIVPVIGGFVLMGRQQGRLNRIWDLARR